MAQCFSRLPFFSLALSPQYFSEFQLLSGYTYIATTFHFLPALHALFLSTASDNFQEEYEGLNILQQQS